MLASFWYVTNLEDFEVLLKVFIRSGLTDCLVPASEDFTIAARFNIGLVRLVYLLTYLRLTFSIAD